MLGERAAGFVGAFVRDMAVAAGGHEFDPLHPGAHAAALRLRCAEYERAEVAAARALRGACAGVPYSVTGRLSSVRHLAGSELDSGPTT
jgi:hypothetical protein